MSVYPFTGLEDLKFNEESVYWYKRALAFFSRDEVKGRYVIFLGLTKCYNSLEDYEMVLDSGNKTLETLTLMLQDSNFLQDSG